MEQWMNHPAMKSIDPAKLELIRLAAQQTQGKTGRNLAPVMLSLITNEKGFALLLKKFL